jgi:hypothetical protein
MSARTGVSLTRSPTRQGAAPENKSDGGPKAAKRKSSHPLFGQTAGNAISSGPARLARNRGADAPMELGWTDLSHDWYHKNSSNPAVESVEPVRGAVPYAHARASEAQETTAAVDSWHPLGELVCGIIQRLVEANDFRKGDPDLGDVHAREFERFHRVGGRVLREQPAEIGARHLIEQPIEATVQRYLQRLDPVAKASAT